MLFGGEGEVGVGVMKGWFVCYGCGMWFEFL